MSFSRKKSFIHGTLFHKKTAWKPVFFRLYYSILHISTLLLFLNFSLVSFLSYYASCITETLQSCKATVLNESYLADFIFLSYCLQVLQLLELKANGFYFTQLP